MNTKIFISLICIGTKISASALEPIHNFGNLKIHSDGDVGFDQNLVNDGITDENQELEGFYPNHITDISYFYQTK